MILILSESSDFTTYKVVKCLEYLGKKVLIINENDKINTVTIINDKILIKIGLNEIYINDLEGYWFRRGNFCFNEIITSDFPVEISNDILIEQGALLDLLHSILLKVPNLSTIFNADLNRVSTIFKAKECGFLVPKIAILNTKIELLEFKKKHKRIIIKPILNGLSVVKNNKLYITYTSIFSENDITSLPNEFIPTLFIEYIEKQYELRVFYLDGDCFCLATFSQGDPKTEIDFRKYNKEKPNRNASYCLPDFIKNALKILMTNLMLKTGSIDIIVTPKNEFVFLEINPVGQFLNIDYLCNYGLPSKIAKYLFDISTSKDKI
jgi:ATP-GRASP peptide maturase of grasp-with-spasm system